MKPTIQFAHANGFPAKTYNELFKHFEAYLCVYRKLNTVLLYEREQLFRHGLFLFT